ncbi:ABC transporter substrate-binding protein [Acidiferrimicrobium sp. IK]|uniref:ABC transporter substrate-binding protein n=1 Tax=Acidiferrimicrobium sp. IK TaxID=2871700 RepID=UPI0021CB42A4|nr:ABC transporter substrate-binding protein [Acidiferrimicrobium sp. IK]MCU4183891.1 ABC transporter substrate-binding protein [Acidiferrimicrobium sp. IK]
MNKGRGAAWITAARRSKRLASAGTALAVTAFGLAACSSSKQSSTPSGSSTANGTIASSAPIKVGIASVESGPAIAYKQIIDGETSYFDMINATGGVNGHKISYTTLNTGYTPNGVSTVVRQLTSEGYPLVSGVASPAITALVPYMRAHPNVVWVPFTSGDDLMPTSANIFGVSAQYTRLGAADARFLSELGSSKIGVLYENDAVGQPGETGAAAWLKAQGKPTVVTAGFSNTTSDLSAEVARLKSAGADGVVFWGLTPQFIAFLQAASAANYHPRVQAFFGLASAAVLKAAGSLADGVYFSETTTPAANCAGGYEQYMSTHNPTEVSPLSEQGWTGGALIVTAIKNALEKGKSATATSLEAGMEAINNTTIGCTPGVTLSKANHIATINEGDLVAANGSLVPAKPFVTLPTFGG